MDLDGIGSHSPGGKAKQNQANSAAPRLVFSAPLGEGVRALDSGAVALGEYLVFSFPIPRVFPQHTLSIIAKKKFGSVSSLPFYVGCSRASRRDPTGVSMVKTHLAA